MGADGLARHLHRQASSAEDLTDRSAGQRRKDLLRADPGDHRLRRDVHIPSAPEKATGPRDSRLGGELNDFGR